MHKASDFVYAPEFKAVELDSTVLRKIEQIKKEKIISKIIIGYQGKDNKIYYSDNEANRKREFNIFDELSDEKRALFVLLVLYDIEKKKYVKMSRMAFYYDEYLPSKADCASYMDYPID